MIHTPPLFNARVLRQSVAEHVAKENVPSAEQHAVLVSWADRIHKGELRGYSETQVEQAFVSAVFVDVLGYSPIGAGATHHVVPKRTGATGRDIPDFVLGTFTPRSGIERWRAVGEIKGLSVNLDLPQSARLSRETPVQQGFRYALRGRPGVEWVLVTNFSEIRLYRNGYSGSYHGWTLEQLRDFEAFTEFFVLLQRRHLVPDSGESETLRILNRSISVGLKLAEGFYGVYDLARSRLVDALASASVDLQSDPELLLGKAHKLLNRGLFTAFCEDHPAQLLPSNTLQTVQSKARESGDPATFWREYRTLFRLLDKGSPPGAPHAFHAFNGGLFAYDPIVDELDLPAELFFEPITVAEKGRHGRTIEGIFGFHVYDFAEELDVDTLGAIFEQSLKDLPHEAAAVRGHGSKSVTRRKKRGVFYTPKAMTSFLVRRALAVRLGRIREGIIKGVSDAPLRGRYAKRGRRKLTAEQTRDIAFLEQYLERLKGVTVVDPACGSGAFLVEMFEQLRAEYTVVNDALGELRGGNPLFGLDHLILRNNLHGTDILQESVEISKLSIWLRTATSDEPLENLKYTLRTADALRETSFADRFDIVVSNPPWGADAPGWTNSELEARFPFSGSEKDTYAFFMQRIHEILEEKGVVAVVLPNSWLTVRGAEDFRKWLLSSFHIIEIVNVWKIFSDVNHDAVLLVAAKKGESGSSEYQDFTRVRALRRGLSEREKCQHLAEERWMVDFEVDSNTWLDEADTRFETVYSPALARALDELADRCVRLGDISDVTVGIQVYHRRKVDQETIKNRSFHSRTREGPEWHPYVTGNEVQRYFGVPSASAFLRYSDKLCDKRELAHYLQPAILIQQIMWQRLRAWYHEPSDPFLYLNTIFSCSDPTGPYTLPYLLGVLNSRFASASYERWANRLFGDKFPKVSKLDLARLPVPTWKDGVSDRIGELAIDASTAWAALRDDIRAFHEFLLTSNENGLTKGAFHRFWEIERDTAIEALAKAKAKRSSREVQALLSEWDCSREVVNRRWARVSSIEDEMEELVRLAYDVDASIYAELIERVPAATIDEALLPR
jgi:hypothetical protein